MGTGGRCDRCSHHRGRARTVALRARLRMPLRMGGGAPAVARVRIAGSRACGGLVHAAGACRLPCKHRGIATAALRRGPHAVRHRLGAVHGRGNVRVHVSGDRRVSRNAHCGARLLGLFRHHPHHVMVRRVRAHGFARHHRAGGMRRVRRGAAVLGDPRLPCPRGKRTCHAFAARLPRRAAADAERRRRRGGRAQGHRARRMRARRANRAGIARHHGRRRAFAHARGAGHHVFHRQLHRIARTRVRAVQHRRLPRLPAHPARCDGVLRRERLLPARAHRPVCPVQSAAVGVRRRRVFAHAVHRHQRRTRLLRQHRSRSPHLDGTGAMGEEDAGRSPSRVRHRMDRRMRGKHTRAIARSPVRDPYRSVLRRFDHAHPDCRGLRVQRRTSGA